MSEVNRIVGDATCGECGAAVKVKLSKKNKLYYVCDVSGGGCGLQLMCRDPQSEKHLARRMTRWVKREDRIAYLGSEALPAKARGPEPEPQPEPEPIEPESEPEPAEPEPQPEPEAAPPTRRAPPRRPSPNLPAKKKSALDKFLFGE
jgi:hypothetical protein